MVLISKVDQDRVSRHIQNIENELRLLRGLLDDVAHRSNTKGFLQVGKFVTVAKKAETPNKSKRVVVKCGKIASVEFSVKKIKVEHVEIGASEEKEDVEMIEEFDSDNYVFKKIQPDNSDDDSEEGSSVERFEPNYDDVLNDDTDWWVDDIVTVM